MLEVKDLDLHYGKSQILYKISLKAKVGEVTAILGTNGVGKTSLIKAIAGTHNRSSGEISLAGKNIGILQPHALAKKGVAVVPQGREIFPLLTVKENLETGFGCLTPKDRAVSDEVYDLFPVLNEMRNRRGGDLSGGQQQQLAIGRALVTKPKLLLMDEPTEGIQPNIIKQIGKVIEYLRKNRNMAIILVEQYFDFAYNLADNFVVLKRGEVTKSGSKEELSKKILLDAVSV